MATKYEYYDTGDNLDTDPYAQYYAAQVFTPQVTHTITHVVLKGRRTGNHTGSLYVQIRSVTVDGFPTSTVLASGSILINNLPATNDWFTVTLSPNAQLTALTKYCIVCYSNGSSVNHPVWRVVSVTGTYANGYWCWSTDFGATWGGLLVQRDAMFEEWGDPVAAVKNFYAGGFANAKRLTRMRGW